MSSSQAFDIEFLTSIYEQFKADPSQVHPSWCQYFQTLDTAPEDRPILKQTEDREEVIAEQYRMHGHLFANVNPISLEPPQANPLNQSSSIAQKMQKIYCGSIGYEYKHIRNPEMQQWLQARIESEGFQSSLSTAQKQFILEYLSKSEIFESFLHTKYVGQKRFSLEGAETLIPMLGLLIEKGAETNLTEVVLGMAHRGRLNVLSNILNKSPQRIFSEFDESHIPDASEGGMGDVKYHKGYTSDFFKTHTGKKVKMTLVPNPSHLESVDAVAQGCTRAKQFLQGDERARKAIIPILIHGDAALTGQGIVYEVMQLYKLPGYTIGGTLHFVINNQVGFTASPSELRSTKYCTDIARTFDIPIFHVNAEDPEACVRIALLALEMRQTFHCDVFIDLNCYRKYGHNETDEPFFTQPLEYKLIRQKRSIRELYLDLLIQQSVIEKSVVQKMEEGFKKGLHDIHNEAVAQFSKPQDLMEVPSEQLLFDPFYTGVPQEKLIELTKRFSLIPQHLHLHSKLEHLIKERLSMGMGNKSIDWGMAEFLAYASLLNENVSIRFSGQDSGRGTFTHRHAIWVDQVTGERYCPLDHIQEGQSRFEIINSPLSEFAALGFEYGYSIACLQGLTIWEAQFGDFVNGAQVIVDQYIASGEQKWGQKSAIVLFLPHGYEGQGPEHSSARIERFLSLCGHDNMQVVNPTTPLQLFHLLRRQELRSMRKPLIVFTPKGLLRHPDCVNKLTDFTEGAFQEIIDDPTHPEQATRLVLCSGRLYYDLIARRQKNNPSALAIIRIEQLYPLNRERLSELVSQYAYLKECFWVQEEPRNMGAWHFIYPYLNEILPKGFPLQYAGRGTSATPATGAYSIHKKEQENFFNQVFHV